MKTNDDREADMEYLDRVYPQAEFEKDMMHLDVVAHYQKHLEQTLGHAVEYDEAEYVAYGWGETKEQRIEWLRQKYAAAQPPDVAK
jgi:hypothetical protein